MKLENIFKKYLNNVDCAFCRKEWVCSHIVYEFCADINGIADNFGNLS